MCLWSRLPHFRPKATPDGKAPPHQNALPPTPPSAPPQSTVFYRPPYESRSSMDYPPPLTIPPTASHKQSIIILHGRGSNSEMFSHSLLAYSIPSFTSLQAAFPQAKFVFPGASKRRATVYKRTAINQWFDMWHLSEPSTREELQLDGLRETSACVHALLRREIEEVGAGNVVLWGLSQGCAAGLIAMLAWEGDPFGAVVGMCGWLPLRKRMEDLMKGPGSGREGDDGHEDIFARDEGETVRQDAGLMAKDPILQAVEYLRDQLELEKSSEDAQLRLKQIPVFLGHGSQDEKVPTKLGKDASKCLGAMGMSVEWREYEGLGHWYSGPMLKDIVTFLKDRLKDEVG